MEFAFRPSPENREIADNSWVTLFNQGVVMLRNILIVGLGGFVGSVARFKLSGFLLHRSEAWNFPLSTLVVNLIGCFAIGILAALVEHHDLLSSGTRLFLFTGLLGGFTTFSAFAYEDFFLIRRGFFDLAALYAGISVAGGLFAVAIGFKLVDLFWRTHH
jgi:fluoride exporter